MAAPADREVAAAPAEEPAQAPATKGESGVPSLPFTGADVVTLVALTLSLLAAAFALRRFSSR
jgi:hypothetical protein